MKLTFLGFCVFGFGTLQPQRNASFPHNFIYWHWVHSRVKNVLTAEALRSGDRKVHKELQYAGKSCSISRNNNRMVLKEAYGNTTRTKTTAQPSKTHQVLWTTCFKTMSRITSCSICSCYAAFPLQEPLRAWQTVLLRFPAALEQHTLQKQHTKIHNIQKFNTSCPRKRRTVGLEPEHESFLWPLTWGSAEETDRLQVSSTAAPATH